MLGITRAVLTLAGALVAGFLIWLAAQMDSATEGGYWAAYGIVAAAGLAMALSQILGGWTKWGWPRLSFGVFVIGFLPAAAVGLWVLFAHQPGDALLDTDAWSRSIGVDGVVTDLGGLLGAVAFGLGLTLGFTFDTTGPKRVAPGQPIDARGEPEPVEDTRAADEPVSAERAAVVDEESAVTADEPSAHRT